MLEETPSKIIERTALTINPAKTCQPIGAMYAALGIHGCLPHSHGSQGCCAYHRSHLTRHLKEPVMASTSSFTEGSAVFGGLANLTAALGTIFELYDPEIVAVHTTCLSETIGDDIPTIIAKADSEGKIPAGKTVIHTNTPSYQGSHVTGFANMVTSMVKYFATSSGTKKDQINLIPGWVDPSDMRELKRLTAALGVNTVMFPDTSDVLDRPLIGKHEFYPKGGATKEQIASSGDSKATIALGAWASGDAAKLLETKCGVPAQVLDLPIGLSATDRFINALRTTAGVTVPESIDEERGRLVDLMSDMHQYLAGKKVAIWGDPDTVIPLVEFALDLDMKPNVVLTGTNGAKFEERVKELLAARGVENPKVKAWGDLFLLHQWIKNEPVDLLIGNSYGKYIARAEDLPLVRVGFPILDRVGHQYFATVGYTGAIRLLEKMLNVVMERQDRDCTDEKLELVM
jgi:nitrogenase molybdenum-iron protein beta chain